MRTSPRTRGALQGVWSAVSSRCRHFTGLSFLIAHRCCRLAVLGTFPVDARPLKHHTDAEQRCSRRLKSCRRAKSLTAGDALDHFVAEIRHVVEIDDRGDLGAAARERLLQPRVERADVTERGSAVRIIT